MGEDARDGDQEVNEECQKADPRKGTPRGACCGTPRIKAKLAVSRGIVAQSRLESDNRQEHDASTSLIPLRDRNYKGGAFEDGTAVHDSRPIDFTFVLP